MTTSPIELYKEILDGLPRPPISTEGEKYEKFKRIAKILSQIFTPIVWVEWENSYQGLFECFEGRIDPNEFDSDYRRIHEGKYPGWFPNARLAPRLTTYLIVALSDFGIEKIELYIAQNRDVLTRFFSEEDLYAFSAGWYNACETGKHIFQNFKPMLGRGNPEPKGLNPKEIKRLMQGSAMLDTATFNRYSIRNFSVNVSGILDSYAGGKTESGLQSRRKGMMSCGSPLSLNFYRFERIRGTIY